MTYREFVLCLFDSYPTGQTFSCSEICERLVGHFAVKSKYLSGSVSSTLRKMVTKGELEIDTVVKGPRGGNMYKVKI